MALNQNVALGQGGVGMSGNGLNTAAAMIKELQGLTISVLAGAGAGAFNALAAIRQEDTIIKALNNSAGTITDVTGTTVITDCRATGTITLVSAVAANTVTVNGLLYTAVTGVAANNTQFSVDGNDTADALALANAINAREQARGATVIASAATNVVTITAVDEGVAGNSIALVKVGAPITLSGAVLSGGTVTGGIKVTGATNQVILFWFNKQ